MSFGYETSEGPYWVWWVNEINPDGSKGERIKLNTDALGMIFTPATLKAYLANHFVNLDFSDFQCERVDERPPFKKPVNPDYFQHGAIKAVEQELLQGVSNGNRTNSGQSRRMHNAQRLSGRFSGLHDQRKSGNGGYHPVRR